MATLTPVISKDDIEKSVIRIAQKISNDYKDRELVIIGVLKGAFIFLADITRNLTIPVKIDFVQASSYGSGTSSSGTIILKKDIEVDIKGKDVLIIEDIVDTGITLSYLIDHLKSFGAKTVRLCTFIDKHERRKTNVKVDYACHIVKEGFLVGYGLDYGEQYRELPEVYHLNLHS